jgi:DNA replication protein DnaC
MDFSTFWGSYPRRVGKIKAERIWRKLSTGEQMDALRGLRLWKQTEQWQSNNGKFIPYASTFLAQKRYADEPWTGAFAEKSA